MEKEKYPTLMHVILGMSKIAEKEGLRVYIPSRLGKHKAPYIKVIKAEHEASYTIQDGVLQVGFLPKKEKSLIEKYIKEKRDSLLAAFKRSLEGLDPGKIPFEEEVNGSWDKTPDIVDIQALPDFILIGKFSDGSTLEWDLKNWVEGSTGPLFIPLKDFNFFSKVFITGRSLISWPNGLDLDAEEFYTSGNAVKKVSAKKLK